MHPGIVLEARIEASDPTNHHKGLRQRHAQQIGATKQGKIDSLILIESVRSDGLHGRQPNTGCYAAEK
jgi:hypothetical protein